MLSLSPLASSSSSHSEPCSPRQRLRTPQCSPRNGGQSANMASPVWRESLSCGSSPLSSATNSPIRLRTGSSSAPVTPRPSQRGTAPTLRLPPLSLASPPKSSSSSSSSSSLSCYSFPEGIASPVRSHNTPVMKLGDKADDDALLCEEEWESSLLAIHGVSPLTSSPVSSTTSSSTGITSSSANNKFGASRGLPPRCSSVTPV
eukprot:gene42987-53339_t